MFFEFKEDGKSCGGWSLSEGFRCTKYDTYSVSGNIINITQAGVTGPAWHYKWSIGADGKLELISEIMQQNGFVPFIKYVARPVSYAETIPAPKTDFTKPKVQSFEVVIQTSSQTGKSEAILKCHATDDTMIKFVWLNVKYAGENINWSRGVKTDDTDPRDQTWVSDGFDAAKPGIHSATCFVTDQAGNRSETIEKTFTGL